MKCLERIEKKHGGGIIFNINGVIINKTVNFEGLPVSLIGLSIIYYYKSRK